MGELEVMDAGHRVTQHFEPDPCLRARRSVNLTNPSAFRRRATPSALPMERTYLDAEHVVFSRQFNR